MSNQFLTNFSDQTFLDKIRDSLRRCRAFYFSVSFIKRAGLVLLIKDIEAALARGCTGRIITSTYQNFTDIESLRVFHALMNGHSNFQCHIDYDSFLDKDYSTRGYHTKGYLFEFTSACELIIGSSNITRYALLKNIEWDLVVSGNETDTAYSQAKQDFDSLWCQTHNLSDDIIQQYTSKLHFAIERWDMDYDFTARNVKPNFMQRKALKELNRYRATGTARALVIAASGSGKTYLAAFDALNFDPRRLLYIVHEGSILKKSFSTFQDVFGNQVSYGIYSGESKELDADFVFATNLTMSRNLELFHKEAFDYIIIDECHHATAETYKKIMAYFEPEFLLGLTATPERMDNQDVLELFDQNIPYELRLRDAIINDLVVPFKYYGIRDQQVDYGLSKQDERRLIAQIAQEDHANFICEQIEGHRPAGKLKALAFCSTIAHARIMSEVMSDQYRTAYLTGRNTIGERIRAYNDLQSDHAGLEILFTVDILNEGVDIPGVNMVLFLRPTESSTVFIQQLGRGLRKYPNKPYVTILDFIGNHYKRSVQIAFALSSLAENFVIEKRLMMSLVKNDFSALGLHPYGVEIHIDEISKEEILSHIEQENFNRLVYLKKDYQNFKEYIHSELWPTHMDYLNNDCAPDILRFINTRIGNRKNQSYYNFLDGIGEENLPSFSDPQITFINELSGMLPLVRKQEFLIIRECLNGFNQINEIESTVSESLSAQSPEAFNHALQWLRTRRLIHIHNEAVSLAVTIDSGLSDYLDDLLAYGLARYEVDFGDIDQFKLWSSYRMDQVQLKLCKNPGYTMKGTYVYDGIVYIFASIKKDATVQEHLNYQDLFLQPDIFQWECEAGLNHSQQKELIDSQEAHLFIRKVVSENGMVLPFSYVGTGQLTNPRKTDNPKGSLLFDIHMDHALPDYLQYDFGLAQTVFH